MIVCLCQANEKIIFPDGITTLVEFQVDSVVFNSWTERGEKHENWLGRIDTDQLDDILFGS